MTELRPYQGELVRRARVRQRGAMLIVLPTGGGKTRIMAEIIAAESNAFVLILVHRRELVFQARDHLKALGINAGIILAGEEMNPMARVQIGTVQTIAARCLRGDMDLPPASIVFVDEAHHVTARTYRMILAHYTEAQILGLTATPTRRDGRGLGGVFDEMVEGPSVRDLIGLGFLVPTKPFAPVIPDLRGVRVQAGDYAPGELEHHLDHLGIVGDVPSHYARHASDRRGIAYTYSVASSRQLAHDLNAVGIIAEQIDGTTPRHERDEKLALLASGSVQVICNHGVLTEGFDAPDVSCIVLVRPTRSLLLYLQMVGRGLRASEGKTDCVVLDHGGCVLRHGRVEDQFAWTLDPDHRPVNQTHNDRSTAAGSNLVPCRRCDAVRVAGQPCTECGYMPQGRREYIDVRSGELREYTEAGPKDAAEYSHAERAAFYGGLLWLALDRGNNPGVAAHRFKDKFGNWPSRGWDACPPNREVMAWDRHCRIRYAKRMAARDGAHV